MGRNAFNSLEEELNFATEAGLDPDRKRGELMLALGALSKEENPSKIRTGIRAGVTGTLKETPAKGK